MLPPNKKLWYGKPSDPFHIEFSNRTGHVTMNRYHIHHHYEVLYLFSGIRGFFIKDRSYTVRQGDLVIIDANEIHKSFDIGVPDYERAVAYYDAHYFEDFAREDAERLLAPFKGHPILHLSIQESVIIEDVLKEFAEEITRKPPAYELRLKQLSAELLLLMFRFIEKRKPAPVEQDSPIKRKMIEIVRYINGHYPQPLHLTAVSKQFYISPSYLSKMFKEATGFFFTEYVNIVRVKEAQRLLRETDMKIIDISAAVGFGNVSHFGKVFKHVASVSPRDYRQYYR